MKNKKRVLVALSGGVDSGVAAALLLEQGYDVTGVHLKLGSVEGSENKCCDASSFGRVVALCDHLKIPLKVLDFSEQFASVVIHDFLEDYRRGLTPNPCVVCDKVIKIGGLLEWAKKNDFDFLATGHYCRKSENRKQRTDNKSESVNYSLLQAIDKSKDQSYFLWTLDSDQIAHLLFPVGEMSKERVRKEASTRHLPVAKAKESFDVCFIPGDNTQKYLKTHLPANSFGPGEVINTLGKVIGKHFGLPLYTIGQHRGFTVTSKEYTSRVLYVISKNVNKNQLQVGTKEQASTNHFRIREVRVIGDVRGLDSLTVRVRHRGTLVKVKDIKKKGNVTEVTLAEPILGVAPGQSAVFYQGEELVGGGIIGN